MLPLKNSSLNPLSPKSDLKILLCLTPDEIYLSKGDPLWLKGLIQTASGFNTIFVFCAPQM